MYIIIIHSWKIWQFTLQVPNPIRQYTYGDPYLTTKFKSANYNNYYFCNDVLDPTAKFNISGYMVFLPVMQSIANVLALIRVPYLF